MIQWWKIALHGISCQFKSSVILASFDGKLVIFNMMISKKWFWFKRWNHFYLKQHNGDYLARKDLRNICEGWWRQPKLFSFFNYWDGLCGLKCFLHNDENNPLSLYQQSSKFHTVPCNPTSVMLSFQLPRCTRFQHSSFHWFLLFIRLLNSLFSRLS